MAASVSFPRLKSDSFLLYISRMCPGILISVEKNSIDRSIVCHVDPKNVPILLEILKNHTKFRFKSLVDITAIDYPSEKNRFKVYYNLLSINMNYRIFIRTEVTEFGYIPSVCSVFMSASWLEREVWDMFGIFFANHPDLRRILTDYGFEGFPLRKDFPLTGYVEVRYDDEQKSVVYEPVELAQEYRLFDFQSPWELPYTK
jgi:NADH-quinone oxidoreductase subunit C